jgi:L-alanine-DL-glutamate epimerase-like enolase superfamily enzyme
MGSAEVGELESTVVAVVTDGGLVGYGETCPVGSVYQPQHMLGARAAVAEMAPHLLGESAVNLRRMHWTMDQALAGHSYAKAAFDIAAYDLAGKASNLRVCELLGGALRERVPSYASIGVVTPDEAVEEARKKRAEGYGRIQLKVGGRDISEDIVAIREVAAVLVPHVRLVVDANRAWTTSEAIAVSSECRDIRLVLEQPCNSLEEVAALHGRIQHPVLLDESTEDIPTVIRVASQRIADGFGLKVTRVGGLSAMRTIRDICETHNLPHTCDDAWGGDIIAAACVHIAATVRPRLLEGVWIAAPQIADHYDTENAVSITDGWLEVPSGAGLGIDPSSSQWDDPIASYAR